MNKSRQYGLFTDVPDELWNDWHWQVANRIETLEDLKKYISLTPEEEEGVAKCLGTLRMAITPYYLSLINPNDPYDPVRRQCIPSGRQKFPYFHSLPANNHYGVRYRKGAHAL